MPTVRVWLSAAVLNFAAGTALAQSAAKPIRIVPVTHQSVATQFGGMQGWKKTSTAAKAREWKPSEQWLKTEGKRYGTLIIVSDKHPGPGVDPLTGKTSPTEDFMPDRQEIDFRNMMQSEWNASIKDGQRRTLVLAGDNLEFMQTTTGRESSPFPLPKDRFGPLNTPRAVRAKLDAIHQGHPGLFGTYRDHMLLGNPIVVVPGNHDRQLQHPAVRAHLRALLISDMVSALEGKADFEPKLDGEKRHLAAIRAARGIVKDRFEIVPQFFLHGDTFIQHGNQTDPFNSFTTMLGSYYSKPLARNEVIESAMGDYIVKALFNEIEARIPWGDNRELPSPLKAIFGGSDRFKKHPVVSASVAPWALARMPAKYRYILTRDGHPGPEVQKAIDEKERADIGRMVSDFDLVGKLNELRQGQPPLDQKKVVDLLVEYQKLNAKPALSYFKAGTGVWSRIVQGLGMAKTLKHDLSSGERAAREERAIAFLCDRLGIKTYATGHDHTFRAQRYIVGEPGQEHLSQLLDDATWEDSMPSHGRDALTIPTERRGVIKITYDKNGSDAQLLHWDPERNQLADTAILPSAREALDDVRGNMYEPKPKKK